jgi:hypothetical protein
MKKAEKFPGLCFGGGETRSELLIGGNSDQFKFFQMIGLPTALPLKQHRNEFAWF